MNSPAFHFAVFVGAALLTFLGSVWMATRSRAERPTTTQLAWLCAVVVVGGMMMAKFGNNVGLPWWIYYPVPLLLTLIAPPVALKMSVRETLVYVVLALLSSPAIHLLFSLFLGWHEFLPFIPVPYLFGG